MTFEHTLLFIVVFLLGYGGTFAVKHHAERLDLLDVPNHRSSHARATPRGGGLGIVLGGSAAGLWLALLECNTPLIWSGVVFLSLIIAMLGLVDDARNIPAKIRFGVQLVSVAALLLLLGDLPYLALPFALSLSGLILSLLISLAALWWINLFNFMDGIDGIAAMQALFMLFAAAGLALMTADSQPLTWWMLCLAAASAGFLILNWPPAKIFMGDVGSTYLGFMMFAIAILSVQSDALSYQVWMILAAAFATDASVTLITRLIRGERIFEAHRSHLYQRLARRFAAHRPVTLLFFAINLFWLLPLAWGSVVWPRWAWACVFVAYAPLVVATITLKAGKKGG